MDYTTAAKVIEALHVKSAGGIDAALIARLVSAASATTDRLCTGSLRAVDYFKLADVANEKLNGIVDNRGNVLCFPKKAPINSVASVSTRQSPVASWNVFNLSNNADLAEIQGPSTVYLWTQLSQGPGRIQVQLSYNGGYGADSTGLPADLVELATLMAGRIYREDEGGLQDAIGIATIGSITFTKAVPERYEYLLSQFKRTVPYDYA